MIRWKSHWNFKFRIRFSFPCHFDHIFCHGFLPVVFVVYEIVLRVCWKKEKLYVHINPYESLSMRLLRGDNVIGTAAKISCWIVRCLLPLDKIIPTSTHRLDGVCCSLTRFISSLRQQKKTQQEKYQHTLRTHITIWSTVKKGAKEWSENCLCVFSSFVATRLLYHHHNHHRTSVWSTNKGAKGAAVITFYRSKQNIFISTAKTNKKWQKYESIFPFWIHLILILDYFYFVPSAHTHSHTHTQCQQESKNIPLYINDFPVRMHVGYRYHQPIENWLANVRNHFSCIRYTFIWERFNCRILWRMVAQRAVTLLCTILPFFHSTTVIYCKTFFPLHNFDLIPFEQCLSVAVNLCVRIYFLFFFFNSSTI